MTTGHYSYIMYFYTIMYVCLRYKTLPTWYARTTVIIVLCFHTVHNDIAYTVAVLQLYSYCYGNLASLGVFTRAPLHVYT